MKNIIRTLFALSFLQLAAIFALANGPGNLDLTFAGTGFVRGAELPLYTARDVVVQTDGKILIVAHDSLSSRMYVARFNPDGTFDASFGNGGLLYPGDLIGRPTISASLLLLQPDGKILVQGVIRLNSHGTLDTTFDGDGWVDVRYGNNPGGVEQAALGPDGKITVQGRFVDPRFGSQYAGTARFNSDGSPDTTFGVNGSIVNFHPGFDFSILPDGKMIAGSDSLKIIRRNSDGSLDTTYNGTGTSQEPPITGGTSIRAVELVPDGKVMVAGSISNGVNDDFAVVRYNSDGSLDNTFNGTGLVITPVLSGNDRAYALSVQTDGKIVVSGIAGQGVPGDANLVLVRYNIDGSLDTTYGSNGKAVFDFGFAENNISMALDSSDKAVVAGQSQTPFVARITSEAAPLVEVGGRVTSINGMGISTATVILKNSNNERRYALTNAFGYYGFSGVSSNETYVVSVSNKRYRFQPSSQSITLINSIANVDFTGNTGSETLVDPVIGDGKRALGGRNK
jgi:uncharacterized delta-60 repeat protein